MSVEFTKGGRVAFTTSGFRLEGVIVRQRKSDGKVTVNAPVIMRRLNLPPVMDAEETMLWDVDPEALEVL